MQGTNLTLLQVSPEALQNMISDTMKDVIQQEKKNTPQPECFLDTEQMIEFVKVSKITLYNWRNSGKIPFVKIGARVLYNKQEVIEALMQMKGKKGLLNNKKGGLK